MASRCVPPVALRWRRSIPACTLAGALTCAMGLTAPASAQDATGHSFGIGYVANAPDMMGGGGAHFVFPVLGGLGVYVDMKVDLGSPDRDDTFISTLTARQVEETVTGAEFRTAEDSWRGFNIAVVRPLTPALKVYAGAGYATRTRYRQYIDPDGELGLLGYFWVEAPEEEWNTVNALAGGFLRMTRWIDFQFGLETAPRGFTVGGSLRIPPR